MSPTRRPAFQDWRNLYKSRCPETIVNTLSFYSSDTLLGVQGTLRRGKNNPPTLRGAYGCVSSGCDKDRERLIPKMVWMSGELVLSPVKWKRQMEPSFHPEELSAAHSRAARSG